MISTTTKNSMTERNCGTVTWRIDRGLLVAPPGRGNGWLRIRVTRPEHAEGDKITARVSSEVANFYPALGGWGWFAKVGAKVYRYPQLKIHVIVTNGFLRSLARLELVPSKVGQLRTEIAEGAPAASPPARP